MHIITKRGLFFLLIYFTYADYTSTIQPGTHWGTWDGWGVSLCWWASVFGQRDDLANVIFSLAETTISGEKLPGLGLNIARFNAGASTWKSINGSKMQVSPNIIPSRLIEGFWNSGDSWDWSADANQTAMLQKAHKHGANLLELFSNSPMWWMDINHNPSGANNGAKDNLQPKYYDQFAVYLATVAKYAKDNWGIAFDSVEPFNEPIANWWKSTGTQEGCHFDHSTQATLVSLLRKQLNAKGLNSVKVAASDESTYTMAINTWKSLNSTTKSLIDQVNVHGYEKGGGRRDLLYTAVDGKRLWNTEYGGGDASGMDLASNLNLDFRWLHPTAWCYWQALDQDGWGLIDANLGKYSIGKANMKYFVLAHYTRHIRPGMTIIDGGEGNTIAAYNKTQHKLVIVTTNYDTIQKITFDLSHFGSVKGPVTRWTTNTNGGGDRYTKHNDIVLHGSQFVSSFNSKTIQTFEVENVST